MANQIFSPQMITDEMLKILAHNLSFARSRGFQQRVGEWFTEWILPLEPGQDSLPWPEPTNLIHSAFAVSRATRLAIPLRLTTFAEWAHLQSVPSAAETPVLLAKGDGRVGDDMAIYLWPKPKVATMLRITFV
jgi:hypothetical protein